MHFLEVKDMNFASDFTEIVPKVSINNIAALVQIMACLRPGSKILSEPMMDSLLMYIRPRLVNMHDSNTSNFFKSSY